MLDSNELIQQRIQKIEDLKKQGINPYPVRFFPDSKSKDIVEKFEKDPTGPETKFKLGGRLHSKRVMGKASFAHLKDSTGIIQLYATRDDLGEISYSIFKSLDLGDIIGLEGYLFKTQKGEVTLHVTSVELLAKCIRPLPVVKEKDGVIYDAFADVEQRYRMRYVDLVVNDHVRDTFITRSRIVSEIRNFLTNEGFLEVETPMMQPIAGGAAARPFVTHHNTLDMQLFLRIAPELYLKRLIVGGMDRVFELNRNFRNEGTSTKHNPEFTMMEAYIAFADMNTMLDLTERLITHLAQKIHGALKIQYGKDLIDLSPPWRKITYTDIIKEYSGIDFSLITSLEEAKKKASELNVDVSKCNTIWKVADEVFSEKAEPNLIQPVFIIDYPKELSPLAKSNPDKPGYVERFEPYVAGREIGNAFTELNDPFDQKERFEDQVQQREAGDDEAFMMDEDYIRALEYGMPPTGGLGIGIDRLVMLLTNSHSIRDTILFPLMRPE
ncbi:lysine--tRNA ligase [Leptospira borgpetersenii]|uniref:Lysine--tRNA ligase n=1 Tax=Leptospira borgpetersenii serovar Javanica str. UI 09931 TaxID=1049767 RepID=A0AAV3JHX8_LEPBO|nr:lysine--tRNA ligase [Leptospira borgpetersenii]AXX15739.1 lysine--tRNA ligase [Leptospira borgpetersenii serovar Ceylonica]EKQ93318.1 lysine--tRNA ligase [Leptospira borgpetersenii str. UI 09149]EMN60162.1 lysine--tRNA ligase [Leptospira borgpetersenii serovar Javanica str. MK146]EPG59461.1 lysine--tRNA ligase [Leptospira borgpetersenii serovar Javanica str. UI 09931]MDQ7244684.1 lysine--tRNA ligase [Leptospira borgpetersenii]